MIFLHCWQHARLPVANSSHGSAVAAGSVRLGAAGLYVAAYQRTLERRTVTGELSGVRGNDLHRPQPLHSVISGAIQVPPNSSERSLLTCPRPWCRSGSAGQEVKLTEMARARMTARGRSRGDYVSGCIRVLPPAGYYNQLCIEPAEHDSKYITLVIHEDANSSLADQTHRKTPIVPQTSALANCWRNARRSDPSFRSRRPICLRPYTEILAAYDIEPSVSRVRSPHDNAKAEELQQPADRTGQRNIGWKPPRELPPPSQRYLLRDRAGCLCPAM
jgi:hypothetical protein